MSQQPEPRPSDPPVTASPAAPPRGRRAAGPAAVRLRAPGRHVVLWTVALSVLVVDQATKAWAVAALGSGTRIDLLGRWFGFVLVRNPGASFSFATGQTWIFSAIAVVVTVIVIRASRRLGSVLWATTLGLVLGGAVGNLMDRLFRAPGVFRGHVIDFIDYAGFFVGNIADIAIVGAALTIIVLSLIGLELDGTRASAEGRGEHGEHGERRERGEHGKRKDSGASARRKASTARARDAAVVAPTPAAGIPAGAGTEEVRGEAAGPYSLDSRDSRDIQDSGDTRGGRDSRDSEGEAMAEWGYPMPVATPGSAISAGSAIGTGSIGDTGNITGYTAGTTTDAGGAVSGDGVPSPYSGEALTEWGYPVPVDGVEVPPPGESAPSAEPEPGSRRSRRDRRTGGGSGGIDGAGGGYGAGNEPA